MTDATFERIAALILLVGGLVLMHAAILTGHNTAHTALFWGSVSAGFFAARRLS